jgi:hypothetical protein
MSKLENFPQPTDWGLEFVVANLREVRRRRRESCARNHECGGRELPAPDPIRRHRRWVAQGIVSHKDG